jgi:hypothetical protein
VADRSRSHELIERLSIGRKIPKFISSHLATNFLEIGKFYRIVRSGNSFGFVSVV